MREQHHFPSLLPYLTLGKGNAGLKLTLIKEDPSACTQCSFPFLVLDDADPLTRLLKAAFVTDSGTTIKEVFLLVQKDSYAFTANQLTPLTNADIEAFWQETHQVLRHDQPGAPLLTLQPQIDDRGRLVPFQSLFFCRETEAYFAPPCPHCGAPLQLCSNDLQLASLDLPHYTGSLRRYLFCSTCFSSGREKELYAHHRNAHDPPLVRDGADLIRSFAQLIRETGEEATLPCIACRQNDQCFGRADSSLPPIVPFSFYPFYMLIHEAMSLNGLDFLAMVAGASAEQLVTRLTNTGQPGRALLVESLTSGRGAVRPFIFPGEPRLFLETLYLKLSFLGQIISELFPAPGRDQPDPLLYLDRLWVKLTDRPGLLPYLWNYELSHIDLVRDPLHFPAHPPMPSAYALHLLGVIWFTALLTNSRQDVLQVERAIERARDRVLQDGSIIPDELVRDSTFLPENVFWHPAAFQPAHDWGSLWEEALSLGWSLFLVSGRGEGANSREELIEAIDELRTKIKGKLFTHFAAEPEAARLPEGEAIHGILSRILSRWRHVPVIPPEEEWDKTVVLPQDANPETTVTPGSASVFQDSSATMVLSPPLGPASDASALDEAIFQETVILSSKAVEPVTSAELKGSEAAPEELAETVILKPSAATEDRAAAAGGMGAATPGEAVADQVLPETVILSPPSGGQAPRRSYPDQAASQPDREQPVSPLPVVEPGQDATSKKPKPGEEDDLLSETIILTPGQDRDRK